MLQVVYVNKQACKLFEYTRSELIGKTLTFLLKTSQMTEDVLGEESLDSAGNLITISGKVVWTLIFIYLQELFYSGQGH